MLQWGQVLISTAVTVLSTAVHALYSLHRANASLTKKLTCCRHTLCQLYGNNGPLLTCSSARVGAYIMSGPCVFHTI